MNVESSNNGVLTGTVSNSHTNEERWKQAEQILETIAMPALQPNENDMTMDDIVQECKTVRRQRQRERLNTPRAKQEIYG